MSTLRTRFWHKVEKTATCWIWTGSRNAKGYGKIQSNRRSPAGHPIADYAHRLAWTFTHGPIPAGLQVLHHCDNPRCVRVEHLFLGTPTDNVHDMIAKGRRHTRRRLTDEAIAYIRSSTLLQRLVAQQFGVSQSRVSQIRRRAV